MALMLVSNRKTDIDLKTSLFCSSDFVDTTYYKYYINYNMSIFLSLTLTLKTQFSATGRLAAGGSPDGSTTLGAVMR